MNDPIKPIDPINAKLLSASNLFAAAALEGSRVETFVCGQWTPHREVGFSGRYRAILSVLFTAEIPVRVVLPNPDKRVALKIGDFTGSDGTIEVMGGFGKPWPHQLLTEGIHPVTAPNGERIKSYWSMSKGNDMWRAGAYYPWRPFYRMEPQPDSIFTMPE